MKSLVFILMLMMGQGLAFGANVSAPTRTPTDKVNIRIRQQVLQIQRDVKMYLENL
jgi:hypothetical protein